MVCQIPLINSRLTASVDAKDAKRVLKYKWRLVRVGGKLVAQTRWDAYMKMYSLLLHRLIAGVSDPATVVQFRDGDPLNCTRSNLVVLSRSALNATRPARSGKSGGSEYKGTTWRERTKRWEAGIRIDGREQSLGQFTIEVEAARAYDEAALEQYGPTARLNFPISEAPAARIAPIGRRPPGPPRFDPGVRSWHNDPRHEQTCDEC